MVARIACGAREPSSPALLASTSLKVLGEGDEMIDFALFPCAGRGAGSPAATRVEGSHCGSWTPPTALRPRVSSKPATCKRRRANLSRIHGTGQDSRLRGSDGWCEVPALSDILVSPARFRNWGWAAAAVAHHPRQLVYDPPFVQVIEINHMQHQVVVGERVGPGGRSALRSRSSDPWGVRHRRPPIGRTPSRRAGVRR